MHISLTVNNYYSMRSVFNILPHRVIFFKEYIDLVPNSDCLPTGYKEELFGSYGQMPQGSPLSRSVLGYFQMKQKKKDFPPP